MEAHHSRLMIPACRMTAGIIFMAQLRLRNVAKTIKSAPAY